MKKAHDELGKSLKANLGWNKCRIECFVFMLFSLLKVCSVNFKKISLGFESKAKKDSCYRRIQRFFSSFSIDFALTAKWLFEILSFEESHQNSETLLKAFLNLLLHFQKRNLFKNGEALNSILIIYSRLYSEEYDPGSASYYLLELSKDLKLDPIEFYGKGNYEILEELLETSQLHEKPSGLVRN